MNRAVVRAFRTTTTSLSTVRTLARSTPPRRGFSLSLSLAQAKANKSQTPPPPSNHAVETAAAIAAAHRRAAFYAAGNGNAPLKSSMYFRRLPVALVSSVVVGYGAWYSYSTVTGLSVSPNPAASVSRATLASTQADALPTRTVLVVGADELRQGTIVGEGPVSKLTGDDGRRIVEMLTPDQATHKLRRLEQSFSVNRGEGVTRYDLVQLPSNDPIEDDHAEKIVEVPSRANSGNSDWMFWGVFDGHS